MTGPRQDLLQLALKAHRKGEVSEAERLYSKILNRTPNDFNALHLLGVIRAQQRKFPEADRLIAKALETNSSPEALCNHGGVLVELGRIDEAMQRLRRALMMKPDYAEAHYNLGNALRKSGQLEEAARSFATAIKLRANYVDAHLNASEVLRELSRHAEAIAILRKAIAESPNGAQLHHNLGIVLHETGDLEGARQAFERAIALDPEMVNSYYSRVRSSKIEPNDDILTAMESLVPKAGALSANQQASLYFALGKAYEDLGRFDEAFANLVEANRGVRSRIEYDELLTRQYYDRLERCFDAEMMAAKSGYGCESELPIFIVGFPRSGTTLVEQILSAHPKVHGAGELLIMAELAGAAKSGSGPTFPESVASLEARQLRRLGESYVDRLRAMAPSAARVTDKLPANFQLLGFIRMVLPKARIIHVKRDPLDTCVSCFSLKFLGDNLSFVYDLGELGRHYRMYQDLMDHWRRVLPAGSMLEVQYENVIEDLEAQARRIVEYCGLGWDERCLSFHEAERTVRTASTVQVRQPIYRSSVQRWRRYEKHLGPLVEALGLSSGPAT
jgi:tetratricopeptide (TPR) repeat protein